MDPNKLKLDPDPEFWHNLDSDSGLCPQKKKIVLGLEENSFL